MSTLPPGPYEQIQCAGTLPAPFYLLPFDKRGVCEAPATRARLLEELHAGRYTDVFVFSHGWNNDFPAAVGAYRHFIKGVVEMVRSRKLAWPAAFRPLLVGIHWPSAALTFGEEEGPDMAAETGESRDQAVDAATARVRELADALPPTDAARLYALLQKARLNEAEALEVARIAAPLYAADDGELPEAGDLAPEFVVASWSDTTPVRPRPFGDSGAPGGLAAGPHAAGEGDQHFDPRLIIRGLTVYQMKDRAGTVGAHGVGPLLREILTTCDAHVHAAGHSYGCRVMLSAVCFGEHWPRPLHSMLLMQGAISHLCFAAEIDGKDRPGGYRRALDRVTLPILCTFSRNDAPLHRFFHLILRRSKDAGELQIAAGGEPPSRFAALGGYGPRGSSEHLIDVVSDSAAADGTRYELSAQTSVIGIDATATIGGHSDISNLSTYWMLYNLVTAART